MLKTEQFTEEDGLPSHVCAKCLVMISKIRCFRSQCLRVDATLRETYLPSIKEQTVRDAEKEQYLSNIMAIDEKDDSIEILDVALDDDMDEDLQQNDDQEVETEDNESLEYVTIMVTDNENEYEQEIAYSVVDVNDEQNTLDTDEEHMSKKGQRLRRPCYKCMECGKVLSNFGSYKYHRQLQ